MTRFILAVVCLAALTACEKKPHELTLVTPLNPGDRVIAEDLVDLFDEGDVLNRVRLSEIPMSGEAALDAVESGEADIALVSNHFEFRPDIATIMPLYPTVLHIARRVGYDGEQGPEMVRGASVYAGTEGSASRRMFESIVQGAGVTANEYRYVTEPGVTADIVVVFVPIAPERVAEFPDLRLLSMGDPADLGAGGTVDATVLLNPHFRPFVIPQGTYGDVTPEPTVTIAIDKMLVTRSDLDSSVVYDLIGDVLRLRPALAAKRPGLFQQLSENFDASRSRFILHSGTQAYLQRSEPTFYERYSGVAEVAVTVLIALISAALAGIRIFRMRRKNRIDRFYAAAIEIRNSVNDSSDVRAREQAISKVRELQNEAFNQLVDEKLGADESFRIFITLSNDVMRQLTVDED